MYIYMCVYELSYRLFSTWKMDKIENCMRIPLSMPHSSSKMMVPKRFDDSIAQVMALQARPPRPNPPYVRSPFGEKGQEGKGYEKGYEKGGYEPKGYEKGYERLGP